MSKLLFGAVQQISELTPLSEDTIASRILLRKSGGSVTLFTFDTGQGLDDHTATVDVLVVALEGSADIIVDGTPSVLHAGELLIFPANVPHAVHAREPFRMLLVRFREDEKS